MLIGKGARVCALAGLTVGLTVGLAGAPALAQQVDRVFEPGAIQERQFDAADGAYSQMDPVNLWEDGTGPGWADFAGNLGIAEEEVLGGAAGAVFNVSVPTITPYLPDPDRATGTAVVIAPGGGFRLLAMGHEGHSVAEYLAERGVAAFVLKYRLVQLDGIGDYGASGERVSREDASAPGRADGLRAIALVRANAQDYGVDPERVGIVGFSAGADVAGAAALAGDLSARPNFAAPIYGAPFSGDFEIPASDAPDALPPMFIAAAQNDATAGRAGFDFGVRLMEAGYLPEMHFYRGGNHGFGMTRQGQTSDMWADEFFWWLTTLGLTRRPGQDAHEFTPMPPPDLSGD